MTVGLGPQDRLDILALIHQADRAATERDLAAYLSLFLADAVMLGSPGGHSGDDLAQTLRDTWKNEGAGRVHLTINAEIVTAVRQPAPVTVTARSMLMIATIGRAPAIELITTIDHEIRATEDGWKFSRRSIGDPSRPATERNRLP